MFHTCFIPIATCFASTLCHFYTFLGTNLLTSCRSVSSCFLLFLYSRKPSLEIFSELDEISRGCYFTRRHQMEQRGNRGGPPGGHTPPGRGPPSAAPWYGVGPTGVVSRRPF